MLIIDCHAHIYSFDEKRYPPRANPFRPPKWVGSVEHLHHVSQAAGVSAVRAIQAVTFYGYDNSYLLDSTRSSRIGSAASAHSTPTIPAVPLCYVSSCVVTA
jgi:hypothetical protein